MKPHFYGVTKGLRVIAHDNDDPIDVLDNLYIEKIVRAYSPFLTHPEARPETSICIAAFLETLLGHLYNKRVHIYYYMRNL